MPVTCDVAGDQLGLPFFQRGYLAFQSLQFPIDACEFRFRLTVLQVVGAMLFLDERFHFSPKKPKPGVSVHGLLLAMQLPSADCPDDFFPRQPELLLRRLVAEGRPLAPPLGIQVVHSLSALRSILPYEGRGLPAIPLRNLGMRAALGNVGKTGEIDRVSLVVHVGLENVIVPVFPGWPVLHVALVIVRSPPWRGTFDGSRPTIRRSPGAPRCMAS